jgi:hypothetical protein
MRGIVERRRRAQTYSQYGRTFIVQLKHFLMGSAIAASLPFAAHAGIHNIDFLNGATSQIEQSYGDNAEADISYRELVPLGTDPAWGDIASGPSSLFHWTTGYGDLAGAAWSGTNGGRGEIRIEALDPTQDVTLNSFDLGGWIGDQAASWYVFDGAWNELGSGTGTAPDINARLSVMPGVTSPDGILILQWGDDAWDVGINNVNYTVGAVPIPAALPLFLSAVGLAGLIARRRG